jgi:prepilin-type N-terminal cleavage/methylation domain-containing protein
MKKLAPTPRPTEGGFSLVEILAVVAIIAIMSAVAIPQIAEYIRNYRVKAATQEISRQMDAARLKAITGNVNRGVSFVVVDRNSFRYVREDAAPGTPGYQANEEFGPLTDLPLQVNFVPGTFQSVRFNRLGAACRPGVAGCAAAYAAPGAAAWCMAAEDAARCQDAPGNYVTDNPGVGNTAIVTVEDTSRGTPGLRRTIRIAPGGRVISQQ